MLLYDFFKIKSIETGDKNSISILINPKHKIYEGHFPGNPVTPGVCLTQMVKEVVEHITEKKWQMVTGDNIKFTAVHNPETNPDVTMFLSMKTKDNGLLQATGNIASGETSYFSFTGSFKEKN